jgi:methionine-gamma-lyase
MSKLSRRHFVSTGVTAVSASMVGAVESDTVQAKATSDEKAPSLQSDDFHSKFGREFASDAVHAGELHDDAVTPIHFGNTSKGQYAREGTPTTWAFEEKIAALEGAEAAMSTSCGMAAISQTLQTLLSRGDRILRHRCVYVGTRELLGHELKRYGIEEIVVDMRDTKTLKAALQSRPKVVYFEPHSNPTVEVVDVEQIIGLAKMHGAISVVDNTYLTPYLLQPLSLGADLVLHSATKYIGGHGDCMAGVVAGSKSMIDALKDSRDRFGGILSPHNASLLLRGLKTLPIRVSVHCDNAMRLATFLAEHPRVKTVQYPGHPSHPDHSTAVRQVHGFGGMLGLVLHGDQKTTEKFCTNLRLCKNWTSLGDVKTLVHKPYKEDEKVGIPANYVRVSVGIEGIEDIMNDFGQALG